MVGVVLLINGAIFLVVTLSLQVSYFGGVALGCAGAGFALSVVGYVLSVKAKRAEHEDS